MCHGKTLAISLAPAGGPRFVTIGARTAAAATAAAALAATGPQVLSALLHMPARVVQASLLAIHQTMCPARQFIPEIGEQFRISVQQQGLPHEMLPAKLNSQYPAMHAPIVAKLAHQPRSMTAHAGHMHTMHGGQAT